MVDIQILAEKGITESKLRELFTAEKKTEKIERLIKRIAGRFQDGIQNNWKHWKLYHAIDEAWDAPFTQATVSLMKSVANKDVNNDAVYSVVKDFGLSHLVSEDRDSKTDKPNGKKKFNLPVFFDVTVPLVLAYVKIRWAKIMNDRLQNPFFKFEPLKSTPIDRLRCEVITDRVQMINTQYGYYDVMKQSVLQMLLYGKVLQFIQEEWHSEKQLCRWPDGTVKERYVKEGLRYHAPHPSRMYWDPVHPMTSFNTDTGCSYGGYWRVVRYRDLRTNGKLWNADKILISDRDWLTENRPFFSTVYPCSFPHPLQYPERNSLDRENDIQGRYYTNEFDDAGVTTSEHFERLIPSEEGLGDYDYPVWFRFVVGGADTILYAAPLPDAPIIYYGYDADESRTLTPSLALEIMPFQDQVSNLLTQSILSVKQNLANVTFVDEDLVDESTIRLLENSGEAQYRHLNLIRFSGRKNRYAQQDIRHAFGSVRFQQLDVNGTINMIGTVLNLLERILVISAQEAAAAATHEQTAEETRVIAQSTGTRMEFTSTPVDRAADAWKRQLYNYLMAYGEEEFYAQLPMSIPMDTDQLAMLGFTVEFHGDSASDKMLIRARKSALLVESFASTRDGRERTNNVAMATAMVQMLQGALSNAMMAQAIGPEQAVQLMNQVLEQMGLPRDFKLRNEAPAGADIQAWVQEQLVALAEKVKQLVAQSQEQAATKLEKSIQPVIDQIEKVAEASQTNQKAIAKISQILRDDQYQSRPALPTGG